MKALKDHGHIPAGQAEFSLGKRSHFLAVYPDCSTGRAFQQIDTPHQGALSRAGQPDNTEDFPLPDVQIDILQCMDGLRTLAEGFCQMLNLNDGFTHRRCSFRRIPEKKKPLKPSGSKDEREHTAPWYHLVSHAPSRRRPLGVPAHSCAVTCAHVTACAEQSAAQLQDHVQPALLYLFSASEALCDVSSSLLFSSLSLHLMQFSKGGFSACPVVYTLSRPLSTVVLPETRVIQASFPGKPHKSAGNLRISAGSGKNQIASRGQNCYNAGNLDTTRDVLRRAITCCGICYAEC